LQRFRKTLGFSEPLLLLLLAHSFFVGLPPIDALMAVVHTVASRNTAGIGNHNLNGRALLQIQNLV